MEDASRILAEIAVIKEQTKDIPQIKKDVGEIKVGMGKVETRVKHNEDDISSLQKRSDGWNVLNSLGVAVAGIISYFRSG